MNRLAFGGAFLAVVVASAYGAWIALGPGAPTRDERAALAPTPALAPAQSAQDAPARDAPAHGAGHPLAAIPVGELAPDLRRMIEGEPPAGVRALADAMAGERRLDAALALYGQAATSGDAAAALAIARFYDPHGWRAEASPFSEPHGGHALAWYRRAEALGSSAAGARIEALEAAE